MGWIVENIPKSEFYLDSVDECKRIVDEEATQTEEATLLCSIDNKEAHVMCSGFTGSLPDYLLFCRIHSLITRHS